jgi:hypothetical protein
MGAIATGIAGLLALGAAWATAPAQLSEPPATAPGEAAAAGEQGAIEQDDFDPATAPLAEVFGARKEGGSAIGVVVAPGQVLFSPGSQWGPDEMWTPGAQVRCVRTGNQAPIARILNWGGRREIEWALLAVNWPDGAGPAPLPLASEDAEVGDELRMASWRDDEYTVFSGKADSTHCETCAHHIPYAADDARVSKLRRGAPVLNDRGEIAGFFYERSFRITLPRFRAGPNAGYIPSSRWQIESVEPVAQERFAEILRDQKRSHAAAKTASAACAKHEWPEALAAAQEAVKLDPNLGEAWLALGYAADELDRHGVAATAFRNALKRRYKPDHASSRLAVMLAYLGELDEAAQLALRIENEWPQDGPALSSAAFALLTVDRPDDARRLLRRILELDQDDAWASEVLMRLDAEERQRH